MPIKAETLEEIAEAIEVLRKSRKLIVVEGKKDKSALNRLGLRNVMTLKKPLYAVVDEIAASGEECVLLTDLDREGRKLYSLLRSELQKLGIKIDDRLRNLLLVKTPLKCIEALADFLEKQQKQ
ncbi:MAG: hypothetical protein QXU88_00870 [Candidatus Woesearchaeota archaeon]